MDSFGAVREARGQLCLSWSRFVVEVCGYRGSSRFVVIVLPEKWSKVIVLPEKWFLIEVPASTEPTAKVERCTGCPG